MEMTEREPIGKKDILWLFGYSMAIGALLVAFTMFPAFWRVMFSLGALFLGIRFFGRYDRLALRVWLVVLSSVFFVVFTFVLVVFLYTSGMIVVPE
jgi:hypothetical protein